MAKFWSTRVVAVATAPTLATALLMAPLAGAPAADALVGGPATDGEQPYVVKLEIAHDRSCSGALVEELWVLTAASCFVEDPVQYATLAPGAPVLATRAIVGRTDLTSTAGALRNVVELVPMPGRDLTLARLDRSVTSIEPVSLSFDPALTGDTVEVAGYGRTADEWAPLRMHREPFTVAGTTATDLQIDSLSGGAICMGDGGGPVVRSGVDGDELVAVASRSWQGGCFGSEETRTAAVATRVDVLAGDIGTRVARWALRSSLSGKYVTTETSRPGNLAGVLRAASAGVSSMQVYTLHTTDDGETLALRSAANGRFVTTEVGRADSYKDVLRARAVAPGENQRFTMKRVAGGRYAIRSEANGEYVRARSLPKPCCDNTEGPDDWLLRADGGTYVPPVVLPGPGCPTAGGVTVAAPVPPTCPPREFEFGFEHVDNFRIDGEATFSPQPMAYPDEPPAAATPPGGLPFAVEDFNYPGADQILEEWGVELMRGDGHVVLVECSSGTNLLRISARGLPRGLEVCFRTTGSEGFLTLEVPRVFGVITNDSSNTHLELISDEGSAEYDIPADQARAIGESAGGGDSTLLEIRVTR